MKTILKQYLLIILVLACSLTTAQTNVNGFQWITHHGDVIDFFPEKVEKIQTDRLGNIYVAGEVNDIFVRDSNGVKIKEQNSNFDSIANNGGKDIWLAKYSPTGDLLWHRYAGSGSNDEYFDMVADKNGNCYISGRVLDSQSRPPKSFNNSILSSDILGSFIAKINSTGNLIWHKNFGGDTIAASGGAYLPYNATVVNFELTSSKIKTFFRGGGPSGVFGYQKLFDIDSLDLGVHVAEFDLNGNYQGVRSFPFPRYDRLPQITSIRSTRNGYSIIGSLNRDTVLVGADTVLLTGTDNAFSFSFDSTLVNTSNFYGTNAYDQFRGSAAIGDTLVTAGHYNLFHTNVINFDTITINGSSNAFQEGALFIFDESGKLLGIKPSTSIGNHTSTIASAFIDKNYMGIGGSFNQKMTYSGTTNYIEAVDNCGSCTNIDLFFALFDRGGSLIAEDVIYSSGFQTDATFAMHVKDTMLYIGGFVGDTVIIAGVDTFITEGRNDAFLAAYHIGKITSVAENSGYIKAENGILAYPNPSNGMVNLMGKAVNTEAHIYSTSGQLVKTVSLSTTAFQQPINLRDLPTGTYFLVIVGQKDRQSLQLLITND